MDAEYQISHRVGCLFMVISFHIYTQILKERIAARTRYGWEWDMNRYNNNNIHELLSYIRALSTDSIAILPHSLYTTHTHVERTQQQIR